MNSIYLSLAALVSAASTYAAVDAGLLDIANKALAKAEAIQQLNFEQTRKAAEVAFFTEHGRKPTLEELYSAGYLDRVEVPAALKEAQ